MRPTYKDMAEFFRIALRTRLCEKSAAAIWAEFVVSVEPTPHIAFIELCLSDTNTIADFLSYLAEVPGEITKDLPPQMLLGYAARLVKSHVFTPADMCLRLYKNASQELPETIEHTLAGLDDAYCLAAEGVCGTMAEADQDFMDFLASYESFSPLLTGVEG